ncbi:MAG: nucleotide pyrophosphohydrolase [Pseudomonadota bacterium]|jgi:NTP pyrophosphatase (non-canonical NTP hydrolase)|nr:nucleotide pyrophosphohydrolase [Pseudomonadota bacterium]
MNERHQPPDRLIEVNGLIVALRQFAAEREWNQFHSPKNLVMALTGEVGELCEVFQWMSAEASCEAARDPGTATAVRHEIADVLLYVVRLADVLGVDLNAAAIEKLRLNSEKYPIHAARGSSTKYTEL